MKCELVAVGSELLLGQIVDTNSSWIGEQLALAGIDSHFHTKVGDNAERIASVLRLALERSDAVIVCGGLGPTQDDITRDVIAEVMGVPLEHDPEVEARIRAMFASRHREMPANNLRQAQVPRGARVMEQQPGTAPGLVCPIGDPVRGKVIYAMPGVPWEMHAMMLGTVLPDLQARGGVVATIRSRTLRTWGDSESGLAEKLHDEIERLDRVGGVTIAFLASGIEGLKVRLTAKAATDAEADALLADEEERVRAIIGPVVFGTDDQTMEAVVLDVLKAQGLTLGLAESLTGGMIASRICDVPGASAAFRGAIVSYASDVKVDLLGVPEGPVVSEAAVRAMAEGACRVLGTDCSIAVTGVAGPDPQEGVEPGTVWIATSVDGVVETAMLRFAFDRLRIRQYTTISVLNALRVRLLARR
jgi:nicotinamide-nucleotide amidase